ncbi:hypothetical protein [Vibrio sp. McD22-P3]|nr:hypothetical protein [Vibrio sp. McD22-P3]
MKLWQFGAHNSNFNASDLEGKFVFFLILAESCYYLAFEVQSER